MTRFLIKFELSFLLPFVDNKASQAEEQTRVSSEATSECEGGSFLI